MAEPLTPELLTEWRQTSLDCPQPISLDRMVIELVGEVFHLRTQRDQLHEANNRLLEERRASGIEASEWQEAARLRCIDADEAKGELAAAHTQLGEWRESVVAANRISQGFEARALKAEAELARLRALLPPSPSPVEAPTEEMAPCLCCDGVTDVPLAALPAKHHAVCKGCRAPPVEAPLKGCDCGHICHYWESKPVSPADPPPVEAGPSTERKSVLAFDCDTCLHEKTPDEIEPCHGCWRPGGPGGRNTNWQPKAAPSPAPPQACPRPHHLLLGGEKCPDCGAAPPQACPEPVRVPVEVTRRTDDGGTISFDAPGFTTVRVCAHCSVLVAGGPTVCMWCASSGTGKK